MSQRFFNITNSVAAAVAVIGVASFLYAQAPASNATKAPATKAVAKAASGSAYTPARLPDGQPDIQGVFARIGVGGLAVEARESNGPHGADNPLDATANNPLSVSDRPDGLRNVPRGFNVGGTPLAGA